MATQRRQMLVNGLGALLLPFLVLAFGIWLDRVFLTSPGYFDQWLRVASVIAGTLFVVRQFKWTGVLLAIGYVPSMWIGLFWWGLIVVSALFGDVL